jgi:hypothetical protein
MRTLEMKISDAGPFNQRINPHILTDARAAMIEEGLLQKYQVAVHRPPWYYLGNTDPDAFKKRYDEMAPIQEAYSTQDFVMRVGQALEIATYRALVAAHPRSYFGQYPDLAAHDDSLLYSKEDPPSHIGDNAIPDNRLVDFLLTIGGDWAGIECKNIREWLYSEREELEALADKCLHLDCVPVLIARRIHPSAFFVFNRCGFIFHQTYNQLVPQADAALATKARDKNLLGYFDIRLGNEPDARLTKFIGTNLPKVLPGARERFDAHKDLLTSYCRDGMTYMEFAARVRRRAAGQNEDGDWSNG